MSMDQTTPQTQGGDAAADAFTAEDARQLEARGITLEEAHRQLALLRDSDHFVHLISACVPGHGILEVSAEESTRLQQVALGAVAAVVLPAIAVTRRKKSRRAMSP